MDSNLKIKTNGLKVKRKNSSRIKKVDKVKLKRLAMKALRQVNSD